MSEELGKIEKPSVEKFKGGRKLFFVPLVLSAVEMPAEYTEKCSLYWEQAASQISGLELKLGNLNRIYHELLPESGTKGIEHLKELKVNSISIIKDRMDRGAILEAIEDNDILAELMDWSRCLSMGLQSQSAFSKIYEFYNTITKKRNDHIARKLDETLKPDEIGLLIMAENHQVVFPSDIQLFYIAPPAFDEIKRWLRDYESSQNNLQNEQHQHEDHENCADKNDP
jgi:hypothetical protein